MIKMRFERLIIGTVLLILFILVIFSYSSENRHYSNYMGSSDNNNFYGYVIDLTVSYDTIYKFISGTVVDRDNEGFVISEDGTGDGYYIKSSQKVEINDEEVFVIGTLKPNNEIDAVKVIQFNENLLGQMILRSIFGLILFLIFFFHYWKFDFRKMLFRRK